MEAACVGNVTAIKKLLDLGSDIDVQNNIGNTAVKPLNWVTLFLVASCGEK